MNTRRKFTRRKKVIPAIFQYLLLSFLVLLLPFTHVSAEVTVEDLHDAILEKRTFSQQQLEDMDLNNDGQVDVADLVMFLKTELSFESSISQASEAIGIVTVTVVFSREYTGTFHYLVKGTATSGVDFSPLSGTVSVNAEPQIDIDIDIVDDLEFEDVETITLVLQPGSGYSLGSSTNHTIFIVENDAVWSGGLQVDNLSLGFEMKIARDASSYHAEIESDGSCGIPSGVWPVDLQITENTFFATIGPIQVNQEDTLLAVAFERTIVLSATPDSVEGHVLDMDSVVVGKMTEELKAADPSNEHLDRTVEDANAILGTFTLVKPPALVPVYEAELVELPEL